MKTLIWLISWLISGILLYPCAILSILSGFKIDYHFKFHLWWYDIILSKI
ncbi:hypothetical protein M0Q97_03805 [Candidatus Dojkabacteria bacterium]|jgi:hypothetical protein|nr:hypothetical protein [Candidatus Dojkabacteria bacterium]